MSAVSEYRDAGGHDKEEGDDHETYGTWLWVRGHV